MASRFRHRRRFFESLEPRHVPAGNSTAALVGADLAITGDAESKVISSRGNTFNGLEPLNFEAF